MDTETQISQNSHLSQNIILPFIYIFFLLLENVKTILSLTAAQKQAAGWIWPMGLC